MAKTEQLVNLPVPPAVALDLLGRAMEASGLKPTMLDDWTLTGQEQFGMFKMGWPVTVTGNVSSDPGGGTLICLSGSNFGFAFNKIHADKFVHKIADDIRTLVSVIPQTAPPQMSSFIPPEDGNAPPRVG